MGLNFSTSIFLGVIIKQFRLGETHPHIKSGRTTNNSSQSLCERRSKSHFSTSVFWISNKKHLIYLSNVFNYLKKHAFFCQNLKKNTIYNFFFLFLFWVMSKVQLLSGIFRPIRSNGLLGNALFSLCSYVTS